MRSRSAVERFFEGFEAVQARCHGHARLERLGLGSPSTGATPHERARAVVRAITALGARLRRAA